MVDNGAGQFSAIDPEWSIGPVCLSAVLRTVLARGGRVNIITRPDPINGAFVETARRIKAVYPDRLRILLDETFHDKGLLGDDYELSGSMNFTRRGIETNAEHLILRTDHQVVAERNLELQSRWKARLDAAT